MKLITLNTWGGRAGGSILEFFKNHADVDIFLLQEVFHQGTEQTLFHTRENKRLFKDVDDILPDHAGYFAPAQNNEWGLAAFIRKSIKVADHGDVFVYRTKDAMVGRDGATVGKNLQYFQIFLSNRRITIMNFHGLWNGQGKTDSADRLNQSKKIIEFIKFLTGDFILAGDFNLRPDTQSLKMLEKELGLKNLIEEHRISSTRTSFYTKPEKFADYVLLTPGLLVKNFQVLPEEVSDHAALFLEFE
jgi:endonuclease/exonuclease/phosphatase family metal-dependent hydrolase